MMPMQLLPVRSLVYGADGLGARVVEGMGTKRFFHCFFHVLEH